MNCDSIDAVLSANAAVGATDATVVVTALASSTAAKHRMTDRRTAPNDTATSGSAPERSPRRGYAGSRTLVGGRPSTFGGPADCGCSPVPLRPVLAHGVLLSGRRSSRRFESCPTDFVRLRPGLKTPDG